MAARALWTRVLKSEKQKEVQEALLVEEPLRCFCGDLATEKTPILKRTRNTKFDSSREVYAAPPKFERDVEHNSKFTLCTAHAHLADAKIDEFIYTKVRAILAQANAEIALQAAQFEKEALMESLTNSLTLADKKKIADQRKGSGKAPMNGTSVAAVPTNGASASLGN